ncbi:tRNA pseudouridine(55) synthase TruB [Chitinibacteraceae bacterium HSL-7]
MAKRKIDGVLLLDKPCGITSNAALQKARWLLQAEKAGHTGVLDPFATGLLPLCFGEATKFSQRMLDADKGYRATVRFGQVSTTLDSEGEITESGTVAFDEAALLAELQAMLGPCDQVPPMYSALKHQGRALYDYARAGIEIERKARPITFYRLDLVSFDGQVAVVDVLCSKGTYIRVFAQDLGERLGCGAYLSGLRRTLTGGFDLANTITLEALEALDMPAREALLMPGDVLLEGLQRLVIDEAETARLLTGQRIRRDDLDPGEYRLYSMGQNADNARFLGLGEVGADQVLRSKRLLATS